VRASLSARTVAVVAIGALQHQDLNAIPYWSPLGETVEVGSCGQSDQTVVADFGG